MILITLLVVVLTMKAFAVKFCGFTVVVYWGMDTVLGAICGVGDCNGSAT